jgi:hypothetical protein
VRAPAIAIAVFIATTEPARAEPDDTDLVIAGLLMTPPTYVLGVVSHEGTHALAAKLVGAEVVSISFLPGRDPQTGAFHFGLTRVRGLQGKGEKIFFYVSPKIVDLVMLGGFSTLLLTDTWPENRYGQLALTVVATGFWVDFSKDVFARRKANDVVKIFDLLCMDTELERLPVRLAYLGVIAASGYALYRGYDRTFTDPTDPVPRAAIIPLVSGGF